MVVSNKTYVVDTMIMLILFTFICIGTIFATSDRFVDSQIMPKWLAMSLGIILLANYLIIRFLFFSHLKGTYKNKKSIYIIGTIDCVTITNMVSPTGLFSQEYSNDYKAARLVTFGYRYGTDNANETGTDGHLESWTLAEAVTRRQLQES